MNKEEWRDIRGYEGLYQVSNLGRVKSLRNNHGQFREKILKICSNKLGYSYINLYKEGENKKCLVHRLVALHFIDNPNNYKEINHKDENKQNNIIDNLEWCTREYNNNYGTRTQRASENHADFSGYNHPQARKVKCITTDKEFSCIKEAIEFYSLKEHTKSSIISCCQGKLKSAGKHPGTGEKLVWKYID